MKQTAVEWLEDCLREQYPNGKFVWNTRADIEALFKQAKEMEKEQQDYSKEEVLPLLEMLQKCKEYFLLKTDLKSEERADAIGQVLEKFKNN
jgi:disulfide oxidoreductase YuzD